jgi:prepilin peptidase CpaA
MTSLFSPAVAVLVVLQIVVAVTDLARHRIPNWATYPGIMAGLVLNAASRGWPGFEDALKGFLVCGFLMLVCFLLFPLGGGDLKLVAMMGACLGVEKGVEAMLWTFILGGVLACAIIVWRFGMWRILRGVFHHLWLVARSRSWVPLTPEEQAPLKWPLYLAPSALAAVCVVLADHHWGFFR